MKHKETILIADNLAYFLEEEKELLENEGYKVVTASDPERARKLLELGNLDLAILDIRMIDDDDQSDTSGLELARDVAPKIPKIIFTAFPSWEAVKEALSPNLDGLPAAVDFISKSEGPEALLRAIELALHMPILRKNLLELFDAHNMMAIPPRMDSLGSDEAALRLQKSFEKTSRQLVKVQEDMVRRAARLHRMALIMAIAGFVIILLGVLMAYLQRIPQLLVTSLTAAVLEAISVLFFHREDAAHRQVRDYYNQLEETNKLANLLSICDTIQSSRKREEYKLKIVDAIIEKWFGSE